jgi:hypothetical protein
VVSAFVEHVSDRRVVSNARNQKDRLSVGNQFLEEGTQLIGPPAVPRKYVFVDAKVVVLRIWWLLSPIGLVPIGHPSKVGFVFVGFFEVDGFERGS